MNHKSFRIDIWNALGFSLICLALLGYVVVSDIVDPNDDQEAVGIKLAVLTVGLALFGCFLILARILHPNIQVIVVSLFIALALSEALLESFPYIVSDDFANGLLTACRVGIDGMFVYDSNIGMRFLKPNYTTTAYYNRYEWKHKTDSLGFRNPVERRRADIVLLGDSFIYGHGVDVNQTVGHFIEQFSNYSVVNLARQADCVYEQRYLLNTYGLGFSPKYILYFYFTNDVYDLVQHSRFDGLTEDKMTQFIDAPLEEIAFPERGPLPKDTSQNGIVSFFKRRPYVYEAYKYLEGRKAKENFEANTGSGVGKGCTARGCPRDSLPWNYTEKAIRQMKYISRQNRAEFIIAPITFLGHNEQFQILKDIATRNNISFIDTRSLDGVSAYYLPHDGHYSEKGAKAMANLVLEFLKEHRKNSTSS